MHDIVTTLCFLKHNRNPRRLKILKRSLQLGLKLIHLRCDILKKLAPCNSSRKHPKYQSRLPFHGRRERYLRVRVTVAGIVVTAHHLVIKCHGMGVFWWHKRSNPFSLSLTFLLNSSSLKEGEALTLLELMSRSLSEMRKVCSTTKIDLKEKEALGKEPSTR